MSNHHKDELMEGVEKSKQMLKQKDGNFTKVQEYMKGKSVEKTRIAFRIRCEMVPEIRGNFKDKYKRGGGDEALLCQDCPGREIQTQSHCVVCPRWKNLRTGLELSKIEDLVIFFQKW